MSITKYSAEKYPCSIDYADRLPTVFVQTGSYNASTISVSGAGETFTDSANSMPSANIGDHILVSGATNAANNGVFDVANRTNSFIQVPRGPLVSEVAGASMTIAVAAPARVTSATITIAEEETGTDVTAAMLSGGATVSPDGKSISFVIQAGVDGITYLVRAQAILSTGTGHNFIDGVRIFVRDTPPRD